MGGVGALAVTAFSGCGAARNGEPEARWHSGRLYVATGNTTGVFYQFGGGYADIISRHVAGYQATAEPTNGAVENVIRVMRGDCEIGLTFADVAVDAGAGRDPFAGQPQPVLAVARVYTQYTQVIAQKGVNAATLLDLRGRRISTGTSGSGTSNVAARLLRAAGLDPEKDITRLPLSLPETVSGMRRGNVDALFFTSGLPTLGITELMNAMGDKVVFLPVADVLPQLSRLYGAAYSPATIAKSVYGLPSDVPTVAVGAMIVVSPEMPDGLAFDVTRVLFEFQSDLAQAHPEGRNFTKESAHLTYPVPLHPGARRYFECVDAQCREIRSPGGR